MPVYTVTNAELKKAIPDGKYGPMKVLSLDLRDPDGKELSAEWYTKADTPLPTTGAALDGTVELTDYGWKFKKTPAATFNGGPRLRDPKESAAIVRQHSQSTALAAIELCATFGALSEQPKNEQEFLKLVGRFADWLDKDVARAREAA